MEKRIGNMMKRAKKMRERLSLLVCLGMLTGLLLSCAGCGGGDKEALLGDWETTIDMTQMINDEMKSGMGGDQSLMDYFTVEEFSLKLVLSFNEDDTYQLAVDEGALDQSMDKVIEGFRAGTIRYFEDMIESQGLGMTVDEVLAATGTTLDEFLDQLFDKEVMMSSMGEMESKGTFEAKKGILYLNDDEPGMEAYELKDGKLTLTGEGVDQDDALFDVYPMVFTKK